MSVAKEEHRNTQNGEVFCRELTRAGHARQASVVRVGANDETDLIIDIDGRQVAVELTAYRHDDPHAKREIGAREVEKALEAAVNSAGHRGLRVSLEYNYERDHRGTTITVPSTAQRPRFTDEFMAVLNTVLELPAWKESGEVHVYFDRPEALAVLNSMPPMPKAIPFLTLDATKFKTLGRACKTVIIRATVPECFALVEGSLNARGICIDSATVRAIVVKKLDKVASYRARSALPCWLVIHSAGYPLAECVAQQDIPAACAVARRALDERAPAFEAAFWLDLERTWGGSRITRI